MYSSSSHLDIDADEKKKEHFFQLPDSDEDLMRHTHHIIRCLCVISSIHLFFTNLILYKYEYRYSQADTYIGLSAQFGV